MATTDRHGVLALHLLRFGCAVMVVGFHYGVAFRTGRSETDAVTLQGVDLPAALVPFTWFGWVGVELFFVLSGYVIVLSARASTPGAFLRRRVLRLAPGAWVCATATLAALMLAQAAPVSELVHGWAVSASFWPWGDQIDASYWTLGIEAVFYLLVAAALAGGGMPRVERCGLVLGWSSVAFWIVPLAGEPLHAPWTESRALQLLLLPHGCFFALGMLLQRQAREGLTGPESAAALAFFAAGLVETTTRSLERGESLGFSHGPTLALLIFAAGCALIAAASRLQPWLERRIDPAHAVRLGLLTYPLYLLHQEIGAVLVGRLHALGVSVLPALALSLAGVLALAWTVARHAEPAVRGRLDRAFDRLSARHAPAPDNRPNASR